MERLRGDPRFAASRGGEDQDLVAEALRLSPRALDRSEPVADHLEHRTLQPRIARLDRFRVEAARAALQMAECRVRHAASRSG